MTDRTAPDPVPARIARLLHRADVHDDGTVDTVLTSGSAWLPGADLDGLFPELATVRSDLERARGDWQSAERAHDSAHSRLEGIGRVQAAALAENVDAEVPSRWEAEDALDVARARLDAAAQHFAEVAAASFLRVRELEAEWRVATDDARAPLEDRERALLADLVSVREQLRGLDGITPLLDSIREARRLRPWSAIVEGAALAAEYDREPTVAEHAAAVSGDPVFIPGDGTNGDGGTIYAGPGVRFTGTAVAVDPALERQVADWRPDHAEAEEGAARAEGFAPAAAEDQPTRAARAWRVRS